MADFTGRIRRVRVVESGSGSNEYKVIVEVEGDTNNQVNNVKVQFGQESLPAPQTNPVTCTYSSTQKGGIKNYVYKNLTFDENPIGVTYSTLSTMFNAKGVALAPASAAEVTVEAAATTTKRKKLS